LAHVNLPTLAQAVAAIGSPCAFNQTQGQVFMRYWVMCCLSLGCVFGELGSASASVTASQPEPSAAAREIAARILVSGDHGRRPFAIVDKKAALLSLYNADGRVLGTSSVLLGQVVGDHSLPGVGERTQAGRLRPQDKTTPAGRFYSTPGENRNGESVVWVEPETAFAIHRLRPGAAHADRARRLASTNPALKRASAGCVVVPVAFYESHVHPVLGRQPGVVYVLPERPGASEPVPPGL